MRRLLTIIFVLISCYSFGQVVPINGNMEVRGSAYIMDSLKVDSNAIFNGNVGIGQSNPLAKLHVFSNTKSVYVRTLFTNGAENIITELDTTLFGFRITGLYISHQDTLGSVPTAALFSANTVANADGFGNDGLNVAISVGDIAGGYSNKLAITETDIILRLELLGGIYAALEMGSILGGFANGTHLSTQVDSLNANTSFNIHSDIGGGSNSSGYGESGVWGNDIYFDKTSVIVTRTDSTTGLGSTISNLTLTNGWVFTGHSIDTTDLTMQLLNSNLDILLSVNNTGVMTIKDDIVPLSLQDLGRANTPWGGMFTQNIWVQDASGADTIRVYDDGTTAYLESDNPLKINGQNFLPTDTTITSTTYTAAEYRFILVNDSLAGGAVTINLPTAVGNDGVRYEIIKTKASNTVTIDAFGAEKINNSLTAILGTQWSGISIYCNGSYWVIY